MKKATRKSVRLGAALLVLSGLLLAMSVLAQLDPARPLSMTTREYAMAAVQKITADPTLSLQPTDPAHEIALFALG
jgi:hypothetical protein